MPHSVAALVLPGVVTFDLSCVLQVFGPAHGAPHIPSRYQLSICGVRGGRVSTADGLPVHVEYGLEAVEWADTVVVPGYMSATERPPSAAVSKVLQEAHERGARLASVCVGAFALGHAGVLDGRRCTTHWFAADTLARQFPATDVQPDALYVEDGPVFTSAGFAAGLDLGLHMVRTDFGAEAAAEIARWGVIAPHRDGGQAQFIRRPVTADVDSSTAGVREWALAHLDQPLTLADLAAQACCGARTLARRFVAETGQTPKQWLIAARLQRARELLETTDLSMEEVAQNAGFSSAGALRESFAAALSTSPTAYRRTFAAETGHSVP